MHVSFTLNLVDNLCEILEVTADVKEQWEELGRVLGLDCALLSIISQNHPSILQRHYEMMRHWIKNGRASWKKLEDALNCPLLQEHEAAKNITKKYFGM